jgi:serine/threonine protein phosphatase PrpC
VLIPPDVDAAPASTAVWHCSRRNLRVVAVWSEKRLGLGEDAEPTFLHHTPTGRGALGVYDGLGGSGARHAGRAADGRQLSHAYVASRLAYLTVQSWFTDSIASPGAATSLRHRLGDVLGAARSTTRGKITGTLTRDFPTTLAVLTYDTVDDGRLVATAHWAGDSRCFVLTPKRGLQQLSRDDSDIDDPLELLIADQPMTNVASASGDFVVNERRFEDLPQPCVLACATDGFFGYVTAPAMFEHTILDALSAADDEAQWGSALATGVSEYTADDATIVLVALGFPSFSDLRKRFLPRLRELRTTHGAPLSAVANRDEFVAARRRSWEAYRSHYMHYLHGTPEGLR